MNVIETHQLSRRFGRTDAVHDLNFAVPEGSICALLGANGAGKTTTIHLLMNLLRPSSGEAQVLGVDTRRLGPAEFSRIGYVSESQELPLWMTVRELINYTKAFYPTWDAQLEQSLLAQFGLPTDRPLRHLSRGMTMKANLLIALAFRPKLLVLDEPFSGLDPLVREEFVHGLLDASASGDWTILVSSHDIEEVERLTDRVALIEAGRLRFQEPIETLQARFRRIDVALGSSVDLSAIPTSWLDLERIERRVRFVESAFAGSATESLCRQRFPDGAVTASPMSLREIFVTLARSNRSATKGAAA